MASWEQLKGDYPDLNLRLRDLLFSDRAHSVFLGEYLNFRGNDREVHVQLFLEDEADPEQRVNRFLEASFFEHPHIVRTLTAGTLLRAPCTFTYSVTELTDPPNAQLFTSEEATEFASQIVSALRYLHAKNLVYCKLSPEAVVRTGGDWKLSDFSELRAVGSDKSEGTLSLVDRLDTSPPEAAEGVVSPAWDIWSFGQTLRKLLRSEVGDFRGVILACLNVNPFSRPTLDQLSSLLRTAESARKSTAKIAASGN